MQKQIRQKEQELQTETNKAKRDELKKEIEAIKNKRNAQKRRKDWKVEMND